MDLYGIWTDEVISLEDMDREMVFDMIANKMPIVVWGTGIHGEIITKVLEKYGAKVSAYCVGTSFFTTGNMFQGKNVLDVMSLQDKFSSINLVLAANEIYDEFSVIKNWPVVKNIYSFERYCEVCEMDINWVKENLDALNKIYNLLEDDLSRQTFVSYIHGKTGAFPLYNEKKTMPLWKLMICRQYFNDLYQPANYPINVLVDVGAYVGDSAEAFLDYTKDPQAHVYAFEPEMKNYNQLCDVAQKLKNITCYNVGLSDREGEAFITSNGSSSRMLEETGDEKITLITGDSIIGDKKISFIKMDVEGAEISALKGLEKTIAKNMPFMAISVYHKQDDALTIPTLIRNIEKQQSNYQYKYYLRNHTPIAAETVLYVVPCAINEKVGVDKDEIVTYIKDYIERKYDLPKGEDVYSFNFLVTGYIDSIALFSFLANIEEKYGINISDAELENPSLATIGGLAEFISGKVKSNG